MVAMLLEVFLAVHTVRSLDHSRVFHIESYLYHGISKTMWVFKFILLFVKDPQWLTLLQLPCIILPCVGVCSLQQGQRTPVCVAHCVLNQFCKSTLLNQIPCKSLFRLRRRQLDAVYMTSDISHLRKCSS